MFPEISVVDEHEEIETPKSNQNSNVFTIKQLDLSVNRTQQTKIDQIQKKLEQKVRRISVPLIQSNDWKFLYVFLCLSRWVFDSISEKPPEPEAYDEGKGKRGACEVFLTMKEREMGGGQPTHWFYISTARAVLDIG